MVRIEAPLDATELKRVRAELSLSQSELATRLGVSAKAIQSWEQGWRNIPALLVPALRYVAARVAREQREKGTSRGASHETK